MVAVLSFYLPAFFFCLFGWGFLPRPTGGSLLERIQLVAAWALYALAWILFVLAVLDTVGMCMGILFVAASIALAVRIYLIMGAYL